MWQGYEGKYFEGRDFYDWGIDIDIEKIVMQFQQKLDTLMIYSASILKAKDIVPLNTSELNTNVKKIIEILLRNFRRDEIIDMYTIYSYTDVIKKYPIIKENLKNIIENEYDFYFAILHAHTNVNFRNIHYKMVVTQLCTILDECLANIIKVIGMYYSEIVEKSNIRTSYKEIEKIDNNTDLREYFLDSALRYERSFSGIVEKTKFLLNKYAKNEKYDSSIIFEMKINRDCIIHRNSKYDKKAISILGNKYEEENEIELNDIKMQKYFDECKKFIEFLEEHIVDFYLNNK